MGNRIMCFGVQNRSGTHSASTRFDMIADGIGYWLPQSLHVETLVMTAVQEFLPVAVSSSIDVCRDLFISCRPVDFPHCLIPLNINKCSSMTWNILQYCICICGFVQFLDSKILFCEANFVAVQALFSLSARITIYARATFDGPCRIFFMDVVIV